MQNPGFELRTPKDDPAYEVLYAIVITYPVIPYPDGRELTVGGNFRGTHLDTLHLRRDYGPSEFPPGEYSYAVHWIPLGTGDNLENSWDKLMQEGAVISGDFVIPPGGPAESAATQ